MLAQVSLGQDTLSKKPTIVQQAHLTKLHLEDFKNSKENKFKASVFSVEKTQVNTSHHWFLQLLTAENRYVNFGKARLVKGHLKADATIPFKFMNPIVSLCNEGKYVIGFVNVSKAGVYTLEIEIENFGVKDSISLEITIDNNESKAHSSKEI